MSLLLYKWNLKLTGDLGDKPSVSTGTVLFATSAVSVMGTDGDITLALDLGSGAPSSTGTVSFTIATLLSAMMATMYSHFRFDPSFLITSRSYHISTL